MRKTLFFVSDLVIFCFVEHFAYYSAVLGSRSRLRKIPGFGAGAAKNMLLLYWLLEDKKHKEIVHLLLSLGKIVSFYDKKTQLFYLFYISCSLTLVVCGEKNTSPNFTNS